ncbi:MAG: hypothetical protein IIY11_02630 [Clostridia bacterium]|nr:hypothetical protein [Clostridia bacterium]
MTKINIKRILILTPQEPAVPDEPASEPASAPCADVLAAMDFACSVGLIIDMR